MSETKDRPEADPAIETTAIETLATEEAATDAADIEAGAAVEGVDESESEVTEAVSAEGAEDATAETPPEQVVATAVLVVEEAEEAGEAADVSEPAAEGSKPEVVLTAEADDLPDLADLEPLGEGDLPLLDDEIEHGIAEVFAALQAAAERGEIAGEEEEDDAEPLEAHDDETADGITFQLLGELDRLWHRAA